ncbi:MULTISPECIES: transglutaminase-like domain-containing protein [unclassified Rathayibacter]|uniref:transglutaminase-like domain-containing protein n=1 Tax=unclassified Rathayibacter TaxID=2609250 RepID=UPI00188B851E|nr:MULTISPECIES: transglutaminase family protein [unclassified Rathayibacter]MBF4462781.1 transglutaminase family protein [Rathayibacter sp. VKM Ac-2879]MBF4504195.1 transglutaminase family protein [Rathayibacter sp. VKM Ac-2878]
MQRDISAHLALDVTAPAAIVLSLTAASDYDAEESLSVSLDGAPVAPREVLDQHGTRLHVVDAVPGRLVIDYVARIAGRLEASAGEEVDRLRYLRPSRYAESDILFATARAEFAGLRGAELLASVSSWVGTRLAYVPGSSLPTDGAERTLLARRGVCRDFAHLVVALLRALDVPARLVAVYAPGLSPMDFHAVAEASVDGQWRVVDATTLAPRSTLVRIATGRDAADTAFLSVYEGVATLDEFEVTAVVDVLPDDDVRELASIG